jgi:hypothetical protein
MTCSTPTGHGVCRCSTVKSPCIFGYEIGDDLVDRSRASLGFIKEGAELGSNALIVIIAPRQRAQKFNGSAGADDIGCCENPLGLGHPLR